MLYFAYGSNLNHFQMKRRCKDSKYLKKINLKGYKLNFSRYSDKTAPYNKCLEFITPTDVMATNDEAPPDKSCIN